jgi:hypothetical protein
MPWTPENIAALPDIDLRYLGGDMANALSHNMHPYSDDAIRAARAECERRGIKTLLDDGDGEYPPSALEV